MCVRRWRPGDRCVSFHHYLQGSPGEPGVPGNDGLKGEKVGKLQIKSSPESKEKWSYDVLLQVQHARQLAKMPFRLLALRPILSHCVTLCSCLRCLSLLCFCTQMFFFFLQLYSKHFAESGKLEKWKSVQLTCIFDGVCYLSERMKMHSILPTHQSHSVILQSREIDLECLSLLYSFT